MGLQGSKFCSKWEGRIGSSEEEMGFGLLRDDCGHVEKGQSGNPEP